MLGRILSAVRWLLRNLLALPSDFARMLGLGGPAMPPPAAFEEMADDEADSLRDKLHAPVKITPLAARTLGDHVHGYAASDDRTAFDLSIVPAHVAVAMLQLSERQLQDMAAAGPEACGRWALGMRSGLVGLPAVRTPASGREPLRASDAAGDAHDELQPRLAA